MNRLVGKLDILFGLFVTFIQFKKAETIHEIILGKGDFTPLPLHTGHRIFSPLRRILPVDS